MRTTLAAVFAGVMALGAMSAFAEEAKVKTIASLYQDKAALAGKEVRVQGKVVKVNTGIMGRNFVHLQDGTGKQGTNDLTVTSKDVPKVGDQVTATGRVSVDKDFGYGYQYPLLMEDAKITAKK
ncbi:MAG TPA: OB-fold nucleic acid binding domain-containing protein [Gallionella sp.]|nr:OB-fold nucleic acid binding domain-containing protein [Gallionella sp.]